MIVTVDNDSCYGIIYLKMVKRKFYGINILPTKKKRRELSDLQLNLKGKKM